MHKRRQVMYPSPPSQLWVRRLPARAERRGGVRGVAARPSAGCAGNGGGAERWRPEVTA